MADANGRSTRRFRRLAANLRAQRRPCCVCRQPIDYQLQWPDPGSFPVEHLKPWSTHPHLREDPANLDAAHLGCNSSRGQRTRQQANLDRDLGQRSRDW